MGKWCRPFIKGPGTAKSRKELHYILWILPDDSEEACQCAYGEEHEGVSFKWFCLQQLSLEMALLPVAHSKRTGKVNDGAAVKWDAL